MTYPNFSGIWKLNCGESEFGFLAPPRLRVDIIIHNEPQISICTRQIDSNGDLTVERKLSIGAEPVEIAILGSTRLVSARWDSAWLLVETRSTVSGNERLLEDRWAIDAARTCITVARVHHLPGGAVRQMLRFQGKAASYSAKRDKRECYKN
jgi:hypothetical protein